MKVAKFALFASPLFNIDLLECSTGTLRAISKGWQAMFAF
ncbi:hypothetical protein AALB_2962 [Agarivorans albus MKT 106]|uniref:Uncharacterized protein n=1 Tax=Agarivorans albus MKT 106 TaxID=1331007 RepID=R9PNC5_AGAAL|nr:hypothetical protein AALB_2962 [Agarivorans albus MKT 106]